MNTNTVKKEETNEIVVKEAQVIEYVDKANADRENRIVGEIKLITEQTKQVVLMGSIEIGRRLTEAKALVKHGQWGAWLKDRIDYSQRTANNFMRIYKEYGETGLAEKSQSIANLSYTHALALLDVPAEERAKFAEEKNAQDMKIKELQEAIKTLKAARSTDAERYKKELAEKDAAFLKAKSETKQRMEEIQKLEAKAKQAEANKQAEVKKQLDIAIAKEREELKRANDTVDSLQSEIKELTKKQQDEIKRAKEHERLLAQSEITKRENQIKIVKEEMKSEIQKIRGELEKSEKKVKAEQDKNKLAETLAVCTFAIDELLDRYAQVVDSILAINELDKEKAKKLMADLQKSFDVIKQKAKFKIAV